MHPSAPMVPAKHVSPRTPDRSADVRALAAGVGALALGMGIGRFAYTAVLPSMQAGAALGTDAAGLIASANYVGYFLGALAAGVLAKGAGRAGVLRLCILVSVLTTGAMALTADLWLWGALRFLSGLASAGVLVLSAGIVLDRLGAVGGFPASGVLFSGVGLGIALSSAVVLSLDPAGGWRGSWLGLAGLSAVLLLPAWLWLRDGPEPLSGDAKAAAGPATAFPLSLLVLAYFCEGTGYVVSGTFLVAIVQALPAMQDYGQLSWILVGAAGAPSCLLWAAVAKRIGLVAALIWAHLLQAFGIALPVFAPDPLPVLAASLLFGGTFMGITVLVVSLAREIAPAERGRVVGLVTAAFGFGQIIGPAAAGIAAENSGTFDSALLAAAAIVTLGALLLGLGAVLAKLRRVKAA